MTIDHEVSTDRERLAGATVLVVEDNSIIALDLQMTLEAFGCRVLGPASSNVQALALLAHERPDAAVLDLHLADSLATPVTEALVARGVPFMLLTEGDDAALLGSVPHLSKPYALDTLEQTVLQLLANGRTELAV